MNKKDKITKLFSSILLILIIIELILIINNILYKIGVIDYNNYIITSNSMYPTIKKGSIIIIKKIDCNDLQIGNIVTFRENNDIMTHRIIQKNYNNTFKTKGDNNSSSDSFELSYNSIYGIHIFSIPYIGYITLIFKGNKLVFIFLLLLIPMYIKKHRIEKKNIARRRKKIIEYEKKDEQ